jgi:hypothetical protein
MRTLSERQARALSRLGLRVPDRTKLPSIPRLPTAAIAALEELWPVRLIAPGEDVDAYREHCGAARLVQLLKSYSKEPSDPDWLDEEDLDAEAIGRAIAAANGTTYRGD